MKVIKSSTRIQIVIVDELHYLFASCSLTYWEQTTDLKPAPRGRVRTSYLALTVKRVDFECTCLCSPLLSKDEASWSEPHWSGWEVSHAANKNWRFQVGARFLLLRKCALTTDLQIAVRKEHVFLFPFFNWWSSWALWWLINGWRETSLHWI